MDTSKRFTAHFVEWDYSTEEYEYLRSLTSEEGEQGDFADLLGWDTLDEFGEWFAQFDETTKAEFQSFRVVDTFTDAEMFVAEGYFDPTSLMLAARREGVATN